MITITDKFEGGNIVVKGYEGNVVHLEQDFRDTEGWWFYWCFQAESDKHEEIVFKFEKESVGYWGAAFSEDNEHWSYLPESKIDDFSFRFKFKPHKKCYFAFTNVYNVFKWKKLATSLGLKSSHFGTSEKGNDIPYYVIGTGKKDVFFSSRNHACESTGTFVLQGVVTELLKHEELLKEYKFHVMPFVDVDGVLNGDQGKARRPHDHNRDYIAEPIYNYAKILKEFVKDKDVAFFTDFHSPWLWGGRNDKIFMVRCKEDYPEFDKFATILQAQAESDESFPYAKENNIGFGVEWNTARCGQASAFFDELGAKVSFTLETTYFGDKGGVMPTEQNMTAFGKTFLRALEKYLLG